MRSEVQCLNCRALLTEAIGGNAAVAKARGVRLEQDVVDKTLVFYGLWKKRLMIRKISERGGLA